MTTCDCTTSSPVAESALRIERFDFAPALRKLLNGASESSVSSADPLAELDPPAVSLTRTVLESWPYVSELLSIYDAAIAAESYVSTARMHPGRLVEMVGYQPRPATASLGAVAAHTKGRAVTFHQVMLLRAASPEFPTPVAVETETRSITSAAMNELAIAPIREPEFQGQLLLEASTAAPVRGTPILFMWGDEVVHLYASEILEVSPISRPDGVLYVRMDVSGTPDDLNGVPWENVALLSPSQRAYPLTALFANSKDAVNVEGGTIDTNDYNGVLNLLQGGYKGASETVPPAPLKQSMSLLYLDGVYRSAVAGDVVIVQCGARFLASPDFSRPSSRQLGGLAEALPALGPARGRVESSALA